MRFVLALALACLCACDKKDSASTAPTDSATAAAPGAGGPAIGGGRPKLDSAEIAVPVGKSDLHVAWSVPKGTEINDEAPFAVRWASSDGLVSPPTDIKGHGKDAAAGFDVPIETMPDASGGKLAGDLDLVVCDTVTHSVCVPIKRRLELTFAVGKGTSQGRVTLPLPSAKP